MTEWIDVALAEEFTPGTCRTVDVDGVRIAVFNVGGRYHAIEDVLSAPRRALFPHHRRGAVPARL
jgi:3-phenylpropionate/trans-cinnamate dioxygenase ferredoxin subunit